MSLHLDPILDLPKNLLEEVSRLLDLLAGLVDSLVSVGQGPLGLVQGLVASGG